MFRIIGGDGRQYGPASEDQLRQWIAEGRVNAQTLVLSDGSAEWKTLAGLPDFAAALSAANVPPVLLPVDLRKSKLVAGLLGIFIGGLGVHRFYLGYTAMGVAQIVVTFVTCGVGHIWGLVEGILILAGSSITTDADGRSLKE
jgi:TM2 domain-containing membrane protein YozV